MAWAGRFSPLWGCCFGNNLRSLNATWTDTRAPLTAGVSEVRHYVVQGYLDSIAQGTISAEKSIATTP